VTPPRPRRNPIVGFVLVLAAYTGVFALCLAFAGAMKWALGGGA